MSPLRCLPLRDAPQTVPTLARWFMQEWADHYAGLSASDVEADFPVTELGETPAIFVAMGPEGPCGTAALRDHSIRTFQHLTPWLGGLYVHGPYRRQGVAAALIAAVADEARRRGHARLYSGTVSAHAVFEALGWTRTAETIQEGQPVTVYTRLL
jgi:GNAT superfamily N-acetyltransferase